VEKDRKPDNGKELVLSLPLSLIAVEHGKNKLLFYGKQKNLEVTTLYKEFNIID
jgi:hypothetical protein